MFCNRYQLHQYQCTSAMFLQWLASQWQAQWWWNRVHLPFVSPLLVCRMKVVGHHGFNFFPCSQYCAICDLCHFKIFSAHALNLAENRSWVYSASTQSSISGQILPLLSYSFQWLTCNLLQVWHSERPSGLLHGCQRMGSRTSAWWRQAYATLQMVFVTSRILWNPSPSVRLCHSWLPYNIVQSPSPM